MESITITDVAPRDGLQSQSRLVTTADKLNLIQALLDAGITHVEVTSFVSAKSVPQMADADEVAKGLVRLRGAEALRPSALVPNLKGLERAAGVGIREIAVVLAATETMNLRNINMDLEVATRVAGQILVRANMEGFRTRGYLAVAWECPFEGPVSPDRIMTLAERLAEAGADEIVIADTIGAASPGQVRALLERLLRIIPSERIGVHFHDTRGMGVANAYAALAAGIRRFDSSTGGIGGCPFAPGAAGNVATEDLVLMAEQSGFSTGTSLCGLMKAIELAEGCLGRPLGGNSIRWLRPKFRRGERIKSL